MEINGLSAADVWDYENGFYLFSERSRLNKALSQYELYKMIIDLPGDVLELGVYKAASLLRLASYRYALETEESRKIVGFDTFGTFPRSGLSTDDDQKFVDRFESEGGKGLTKANVQSAIEWKKFSNIDLVAGNVMESLPVYLELNPSLRISMLHLDMDVREPTKFALELLYDRIVPGGLIVIDDYSSVAGATDAVDEFLDGMGLSIHKLTFYSVPAYIKKPLK